MKTRVINTFLADTKCSVPKEFRSHNGRKKYASFLSKEFQKNLIFMPEKQVPIDAYKSMLYSAIKTEKPIINIIQPKDETIAHINCDIVARLLNKNSKDHEIIYKGFNLYFPNSGENITSDDTIIVHETRHLLDFMCNPKLLLPRGNKFVEDKNINKFEEIVDYIKSSDYRAKKVCGIFKKHNFEDIMREKLKGLSNEFVIELLQRCRYSAELELNAYKDMERYAFYLNPANIFEIRSFHKNMTNKYEFRHKKKICEKLLKEFIKKERTNHGLALQKSGKSH